MMNKLISLAAAVFLVVASITIIFLVLPVLSIALFFIFWGLIIIGVIWFIAGVIKEELDEKE